MASSNAFSLSSSSQPLIRLSLISPFIEFLRDQGISSDKPLKRLGLSYETTKNPSIYVHSEVFYGLMNELADTAEDPFLGLHVAEEMLLADWPVLTASLENSRSVGEFLTRFMQNVPQHSNAVTHSISLGPVRSQYRIERPKQPINKASQSDGFGAGLYLRIFAAAASKAWMPDTITLRTAYPEAIPPSYQEATIETHSEAALVIEFPTEVWFADLDFDISKANGPPAAASKPSLVSAVRAIASPFLIAEEDMDQAIADALGVDIERVKKTLASAGTTLSREIKILKCEVVCDLLKNSDISIAEAGARIGYSEPANFTRFFKSQLGMTPRQYRNERKSERESE